MAASIALILILAIFGGGGFVIHALWIIMIPVVILWLAGFFVQQPDASGLRSWYGW